MNNDLRLFLQEQRTLVERALQQEIASQRDVPTILQEAMTYSLLGGGKRLRAILTIATAEALGAAPTDVLPFACAIEMIHTYSLIHDDLPAMDDDDMRRGKPTNHRVYGEATAILAGDALLTKAFGLMSKSVHTSKVTAEDLLYLIDEAARAAGAEGMVGGQVDDLLGEKRQLVLDELVHIHRRKTGALLKLSVRAGAILAAASEVQLAALSRYAENVGLAFQIQDDILDVVGDQQVIGKPVGSDAAREKATFPALLGLEQSRQKVLALVSEAKEGIRNVSGIAADRLCDLADYVITRNY
ncbi:polyprenyl synthetase family protein [Numidum massiliense]|uniref:polyprenyl synthetase family protein n=1 Tax=Numidum massiliense TaxID=1522315 RepID=UPI0006D56D5A|nr:farnesyl diphosphate synthase [Numidum massiliense]